MTAWGSTRCFLASHRLSIRLQKAQTTVKANFAGPHYPLRQESTIWVTPCTKIDCKFHPSLPDSCNLKRGLLAIDTNCGTLSCRTNFASPYFDPHISTLPHQAVWRESTLTYQQVSVYPHWNSLVFASTQKTGRNCVCCEHSTSPTNHHAT